MKWKNKHGESEKFCFRYFSMITVLPESEKDVKYYPITDLTQWTLCSENRVPPSSAIRGKIGVARGKEPCLLMSRTRRLRRKKAEGVLYI